MHRAIQSVLNQTIANFEMIVVNDGSTDKCPEIVKSINDPRIRVIDQANAGVSVARNRGISEAHADLIAFLDADDEWSPDFLGTILTLRKNYPACSVFATNYIFRRKNDYNRPTIIRGLPREFKEGILTDYFKIASQSDPPLCSSTVAVTKKAIEAVGGFPVGVVAGEDLLTWAKLAVEYKIAYTIESKAYFCEPEVLEDHPRRPQTPDIVGEQLALLLKNNTNSKIPGLSEYIALWYRMRANIFIRLHQSQEARKEIFRALSYSRSTIKLYLLAFLTLIPSNVAKQIIKFFKLIREATRKQSN